MSILTTEDLARQLNAPPDVQTKKALAALYGDVSAYGAASQTTTKAVEYGSDVTGRKTVITVTAATIALTDDAGQGQYGGLKIYDFPAGLIAIEGCSVVGNLTGYASLIDTFASVVALGTATATTGSTLVGTEADIMASAANSAAVSEVAAVSGFSSTMVAPLNGTATAKDAYLNFLVADDAAHGSGNAAFTGTVTIWWRNLSAE